MPTATDLEPLTSKAALQPQNRGFAYLHNPSKAPSVEALNFVVPTRMKDYTVVASFREPQNALSPQVPQGEPRGCFADSLEAASLCRRFCRSYLRHVRGTLCRRWGVVMFSVQRWGADLVHRSVCLLGFRSRFEDRCFQRPSHSVAFPSRVEFTQEHRVTTVNYFF